jgi:hypothetical protein
MVITGRIHAPADLPLDKGVSICFGGGWMGPEVYMGAAEKRKFSAFPLNRIAPPVCPARISVTTRS